MKVSQVNSTSFQAIKNDSVKKVLKKTIKSTNLKPIKNYAQYLQEYSAYLKK